METHLPVYIPLLSLCFGTPKLGERTFKMGLEKVGSPVRMTEKEGGTVGVSSKPVDDRIVDPKSESHKEYNLLLVFLKL